MITAITAILGALTGLVPGILQFFTKKADNAHALEIRKLELQAVREGVALQVDVEQARADVQQQQHLYSFAANPSGVRWVDALTTLARPYITLIVFHVWIAVEVALIYHAFTKGADIATMAKAVWDENTQAIFSAIVGFWFGNRMLFRGNERMAAITAITKAPPVKATPKSPAPVTPANPHGVVLRGNDKLNPDGTIADPPGSR